MQGYATAERFAPGKQLHSWEPKPVPMRAPGGFAPMLFDSLLARLADLVVDRLLERTETDGTPAQNQWLDTRAAAEYLGVHRDTLRKLAAERSVPAHQAAPGCKLHFRRDELDEWRRSSRKRSASATSLRAVS
jgi:excisionase family DNA binding protein